MANKLYETLFLLDPTKVSADADGVKHQLHAILERHGAHIEVSRPWDYNHKLSYAIGKQKKGSYHIVYYTMESTRQAEVERDFALHPDVVLRYMTTRVEPKWQEEVMKVAREDAGLDRPPAQVITTTHSPYLLDLYKDHPEEVVLAHKHGQEASFTRLSEREDLRDLLKEAHLGDLWYSGVLGGVPGE